MQTADEQRARFVRYQAALGYSGDDLLWQSAGVEQWLKREGLVADQEVCVRLAGLLRRLMLLADHVSASRLPLDDFHEPSYDIELGAEWLKAAATFGVVTRKVHWGPPAVDGLLERLNERVDRVLDRLVGEPAVTRTNVESYELLTGGYERLPTVALFPFFLLDERLAGWDVLRYGTQTALAFAMSVETAGALLPAVPQTGGEPLTLGDLRRVVHEVGRWRWQRSYRFLYLGAGHAAYRIALTAAEPTDYFVLRASLDDYQALTARVSSPALGPNSQTVREILLRREEPHYVLITDPGEPEYLDLAQGKGGIVTGVLEHGLGIPVGLGISLGMVARIARAPRLLIELADAVLAAVKGQARDEFAAAGVRIDDDALRDLERISRMAGAKAAIAQTDDARAALATAGVEEGRARVRRALATYYEYLRRNPTKAHEYFTWQQGIEKSVADCEDLGVLTDLARILSSAPLRLEIKAQVDARLGDLRRG